MDPFGQWISRKSTFVVSPNPKCIRLSSVDEKPLCVWFSRICMPFFVFNLTLAPIAIEFLVLLLSLNVILFPFAKFS